MHSMQSLFEHLGSVSPASVYYWLSGILLLCGLGLPIPEDISLISAGKYMNGRIITFDESLQPREEPLRVKLTWTGLVLGLMPHPERFMSMLQHPAWNRKTLSPDAPGAGVNLFYNAVRHAQESAILSAPRALPWISTVKNFSVCSRSRALIISPTSSKSRPPQTRTLISPAPAPFSISV